jgi:hypothetical protein
MWPWAHVAVGYLILAGAIRAQGRATPGEIGAIAVASGAVLPDVIDKPLAWWVAVLPHGRTLGHSLLIGGIALAGGWYLVRTSAHRQAFGALAVGYLAHLAGDAYQPAISGHWEALKFLAWPLASPPEAGEVTGVIAHVLRLELTPSFLLELVITSIAFGLWWTHGRPGVATVKTVGNSLIRKLVKR